MSEAERARLSHFLAGIKHGEAMEGFFVALICCPENVPPSKYLPLVWGEELDEEVFESREEAQAIVTLIMRHWNTVAHALHEEAVFLPYLEQD